MDKDFGAEFLAAFDYPVYGARRQKVSEIVLALRGDPTGDD